MTRRYSLVVESGPTGFSAYVPELPTIIVTGQTEEQLERRAAEAVQLYWEETLRDRSPLSHVREFEVELTA